MGWKDKILQGSFRGAAFFCEQADGEIGRRIALHEYPLRSTPYAEDMGRKARRFTLDLFVVGVDYMNRRDALITAIETAGPGKLIHPYLGEITVTVVEARGPRESTREGGMARFSVTFVEAGERLFPEGVDTPAKVKAATDRTIQELQKKFTKDFDVTGPEFIAADAIGMLNRISDRLDALRKSIPGIPSQVTAFAADMQRLAVSTELLIRQPAALAGEIVALVTGLAGLVDRPLRAIASLRQFWNLFDGQPEIAATTTSRRQQASNSQAMIALTRGAAVVQAAELSSVATFDSYDDAVVLRDELTELLDAEMLIADDTVYTALADLRAAMVRDLGTRGADLARLTGYTPAQTLPALVIAHTLYGDASRDSEIVSRNRLRHPGFVPGGSRLEVLTNG